MFVKFYIHELSPFSPVSRNDNLRYSSFSPFRERDCLILISRYSSFCKFHHFASFIILQVSPDFSVLPHREIDFRSPFHCFAFIPCNSCFNHMYLCKYVNMLFKLIFVYIEYVRDWEGQNSIWFKFSNNSIPVKVRAWCIS